MEKNTLGLRLLAVVLAMAALITAPALTYAQTKQTTVTVGNTSANPVPVTGSVTVANPVLQVEVANLEPVRVSGRTPTYGSKDQSLYTQRALYIPANVVLTDLRVWWSLGATRCPIELRETVQNAQNGLNYERIITTLFPTDGQPDELHLVSGIPSDGDLTIFVNGDCRVFTFWSGYTP